MDVEQIARSVNGLGSDDAIVQAAELIAEQFEGTTARLNELRQEEAKVRDLQNRLGRALKALEPGHPALQIEGAPAQPGAPKGPRSSVSDGRRVQALVWPEHFATAWAWIRDQVEVFSQAEAIAALEGDMSSETVRKVVAQLRAGEALRRSGKKAGPSGHKSEAFRVLDVQAGERILKQNEENYAGPTPHNARAGAHK